RQHDQACRREAERQRAARRVLVRALPPRPTVASLAAVLRWLACCSGAPTGLSGAPAALHPPM
ncbi:MAG TPA: hypothetical protein VKF37_05170, partial [Chloroflexota bacterium]|nr:hypothetical protein [Chloroflexota bacterium]